MSTSRAAIVVLGLLFVDAVGASVSWSQAPNWPPASNVMPTPQPQSNTAKLDALLASKQYLQLGQEIRQAQNAPDLVANLHWQQARIVAGGSAFLGFGYAYDLWRVGSATPAEQGRNLKRSAIFALLYTYQLIAIDGVKCADVSAQAQLRNQVFAAFPYVWSFVAALSDDERAGIVDLALRLESATAPNRADDDFLCLGGIDQMRAAMEKNGAAVNEGKSVPGLPGKTLDVAADPDYKPKFLSKEAWSAKQAPIRAAMPATFKQIMDRFKAPADTKGTGAAP